MPTDFSTTAGELTLEEVVLDTLAGEITLEREAVKTLAGKIFLEPQCIVIAGIITLERVEFLTLGGILPLEEITVDTLAGEITLEMIVVDTLAGFISLEEVVGDTLAGIITLEEISFNTLAGLITLERVDVLSTLAGEITLEEVVEDTLAGFIQIEAYVPSTLAGIITLEKIVYGTLAGFIKLEEVVDTTLAGNILLERVVNVTIAGKITLEKLVSNTLAGLLDLRYPYTIVQFNGLDINNVVEITERALHDSAPSRNISIYKIARRDGEKLVSAYFARKEISLTGFIQSTTKEGLEVLIDNLKSKFQVKQGILDIEYAVWNVVRRYLATFSELVIERDPDHIDWCPFSVKFLVPSGKGKNINQTAVIFSGITTSPYANVFNNLGSAEATPQVKITVNTQTALSVITLSDGINTLTLTQTFNNGDVIIIDFDTWIITKNAVPIDYTGSFPTWEPGNNNFTLTTTATARNLDLEISYYKTYL